MMMDMHRVDELLLAQTTQSNSAIASEESDGSASSYNPGSSTSPSSFPSPSLSSFGSAAPSLLLPVLGTFELGGSVNDSEEKQNITIVEREVTDTPVHTQRPPSRKAKQKYAADLVRREAQALLDLAQRLEEEGSVVNGEDSFAQALDVLHSMEKYGKIIFTGVGKSGLLARKAVATFNSLGFQSVFLHPVEALHGDLGVVSPYGLDTVILVSYSGRTKELEPLIYLLRRKHCHSIISLTTPGSPLALASDITLDVTVENDEEADAAVPAPTSSVLTALAMLDTLALSLLRLKTGWNSDGAERRHVFAHNHPGGNLGQQLAIEE